MHQYHFAHVHSTYPDKYLHCCVFNAVIEFSVHYSIEILPALRRSVIPRNELKSIAAKPIAQCFVPCNIATWTRGVVQYKAYIDELLT